MKPLPHLPWGFVLLAIGLSACASTDEFDSTFDSLTQVDDDVCVTGDPDYDPADPRCLVTGPAGTGVLTPTGCTGGDPTCYRGQNYPTQSDLTIANSANIAFIGNSVQLVGGSGSIVDSDGDFVPDPADECVGPGFRLPCDGDPSDDGIYQTLFFSTNSTTTLGADIEVDAAIQKADAYLLMDATGSMGGEQAQLINDLTKGTFIDPTLCAEGADTGLVGALKCVIPDLWIGLGQFNEVPVSPYGHAYGYTPYHHLLDVTNDLQHLLDSVSSLTIQGNRDLPESGSQALYSTITGRGLGPWVPNRGACPANPAGRWGYPCFRPATLPIIILFSDAPMHNGPLPGGTTYDPSLFAGVGLGSRLPPVEQYPGILYSNDALSAFDLGDLTNRSVTVMGTTANFADSFLTWTEGACNYCPMAGCFGDGRDAAVRFSLSNPTTAFVSTEGSFPSIMNMGIADSSFVYAACDHGPGAGDWWGRATTLLGAGDWYAIADASIAPTGSVNAERGPFQLRIKTTPDDPSWQTDDMPIAWTTVENELLAARVKVVSITSPNSGGLIGLPDLTELAYITDSVDSSGQPFVETIAGDGQGLSTALLDSVRSLVGDVRRDVTLIAEDDPSTPAVDERDFLTAITATQCPTTGISNCLSGAGTSTCEGCLADTTLSFQFRIGNNFVAQGATSQVFEFDLVAVDDVGNELSRIPVRVMVPPAGTDFGNGFYQATYEADGTCLMPPERPDWGFMSWSASMPSDSSIEFEVFTANTRAGLDLDLPMSIVVPAGTTTGSVDIGPMLQSSGRLNYLPYLRVRAKMIASSDGASSPSLDGWTMQFNCFPSD